MRTTVTLDPDVERLIRGAMQERGASFKETLNQAVRDGLTKKARPAAKVCPTDFQHGSGAEFPLG